jgi:translation elongation factor EF-G
MSFEKVDYILQHLEDNPNDIANKIGVKVEDVQRLIRQVKDYKFNREIPLTLLRME